MSERIRVWTSVSLVTTPWRRGRRALPLPVPLPSECVFPYLKNSATSNCVPKFFSMSKIWDSAQFLLYFQSFLSQKNGLQTEKNTELHPPAGRCASVGGRRPGTTNWGEGLADSSSPKELANTS